MLETANWFIFVLIGIALMILGFAVTTYGSGRRPLQVAGNALHVIGGVVTIIGLILLAALFF